MTYNEMAKKMKKKKMMKIITNMRNEEMNNKW